MIWLSIIGYLLGALFTFWLFTRIDEDWKNTATYGELISIVFFWWVILFAFIIALDFWNKKLFNKK